MTVTRPTMSRTVPGVQMTSTHQPKVSPLHHQNPGIRVGAPTQTHHKVAMNQPPISYVRPPTTTTTTVNSPMTSHAVGAPRPVLSSPVHPSSTTTASPHHHQPTVNIPKGAASTSVYSYDGNQQPTKKLPISGLKGKTSFLKSSRSKTVQPNPIPYELEHKAIRQISMHSDEDWDAVADHAAIEWGQRRGPRRGRDADDLTVTVRDMAPSLGKFFDKLGCCGEQKTRVLHRPAKPCQPVQQIQTDTGGLMSPVNNSYFPQGVLVESGIVGMGTSGLGHMHGVDQYGGYRYHGEREDSATPNHFDTYKDWNHPSFNYHAHTQKTPLPQFEPSYNSRAFNAAPGMVNTNDMNRVFHKSDLIELDQTGRVVIPQFKETLDGKLASMARI